MSEIETLRAEIEELRARVAELEAPATESATEALQSILSATPALIARVDADLAIRFVNHLQPGSSLEDVIGRPVFDLIATGYHAVAKKAFAHTQTTGEGGRYDVEGIGPNGESAHYQTHIAPVHERDGRIGFFLIALDVSDLLRKETQLAESERKLSFALESTKLGLWSWDLATGEVLWDDRMRRLMGIDGISSFSDYAELVHREDRAEVQLAAERSLLLGRFESRPHRIVRGDDGEVRWMLTVGKIAVDGDGKPVRVEGGNLDVTEQRNLEEKLRRTQKRETIGKLTAGVAHNFNNMLMAVLPSLELLREVIPPSHIDVLNDAADATERAADMVRKLMTFAGQRQPPGGGCDVGEVAQRVVAMCEGAFDRHIALRCTVDAANARVNAASTDVEQVLLNLLLNARDAVVASNAPSPRIEVLVGRRVTPDKEMIVLRVSDDGVGMTPAAMQNAFEPFVSTKDVGKGTGLGLPTSYAIARDHGGSVDIESELGTGTTVTVLLPGAEVESQNRPAASPAPAPTVSERARVLLIDDEPMIRRVMKQALAHEGYEVAAASNGEEAIEALRLGTFDVILLDRSMPGSPGTALLPALRESAPRAAIVYFTGQDVSPQEQALVEGVIYKPVRISELVATIEDLVRKRT